MLPTHANGRFLLALLAALGVLLRAAIPVGYMPGDLSGGAWVTPCPSGFPAAWFAAAGGGGTTAAHAHHHPPGHEAPASENHHDPGAAGAGLEDRCPLGEAPQAPALIAHLAPIPAAPLAHMPPARRVAGAAARAVPGLPEARAPPLS